MANKGTQERQCQTGTADLAEAVFDCLSTGMKITVGFVFVVVFSSAISAIAAVSSVSAGSAVATGSAAPVVSGSLKFRNIQYLQEVHIPPKVQQW